MNFDTTDRCQSSLSVTGEHLRTSASTTTPPKKTYKYKRVAKSSSVDETLFSSHREKQLSSRPSSASRKSSRQGSRDCPPRTNSAADRTPPIKSALTVNSTGRPQSRSGYRVTATKSYIDESLFGPKLQTPTFDAPWDDDKEEKKRGKPLFWSPPVAGSLSCTPDIADDARPASAVASRPSSATANRPPTPSKPPWK
ncbi:LOW QUALITY PROTEIN: uncharacterized protein [Amphiura filiformis]|uniref:LOW QUALITY PROTEIN: uncharacterized protein n=1 Tax=Amphiura filiformis TaxID=82378 RepID=UPI003B223EBC